MRDGRNRQQGCCQDTKYGNFRKFHRDPHPDIVQARKRRINNSLTGASGASNPPPETRCLATLRLRSAPVSAVRRP
jgi:hypothetical protein